MLCCVVVPAGPEEAGVGSGFAHRAKVSLGPVKWYRGVVEFGPLTLFEVVQWVSPPRIFFDFKRLLYKVRS